MKKLLLIVGIVSIVACILFLLYAALNLYGFNNLYDGTAEHYQRLHNKSVIFFVSGFVLAAIGAVCFIIRLKI